MNDNAIRFRLGVFVLASMLIFAVLIALFGGKPTWFKQTKPYTIVVSNASGLGPGSPVRKSGVKIGEVTSVQLDDQTGKVNVGIEVEKQFSFHKSDTPTVLQSLLGGDAYIAFLPPPVEPGKLDNVIDATPVPPGSIIPGVIPTDPGTVLQKTSDLLPGAQETLIEIKKVFTKIDKMAPTLEAAVKDFSEFTRSAKDVMPDIRQIAKSANETMPSVKKTVEELEVTSRNWGKVGERVNVLLQTNDDKIVRTLENVELTTKRAADLLNDDNQKVVREILKDVRTGSARLESLSRNSDELIQEARITVRTMNKTLGKADEFMTQVTKVTAPLGERGPTILKNLEEASVTLNKTLADARELLQVIGRSEGTFQKFINDPSLYNNINDTALMATRIMPRLDRAMRDFEIFADRLARHPEAIGLGGVVRPSSGVKETPGFWPPR